MIELIGTNAGLVWNALNEGGKMSVKYASRNNASYRRYKL